jgi:hypothetical protein
MNDPRRQVRYKNWFIEYNPKPVPSRRKDYDFWHAGDPENRYGYAKSFKQAIRFIDEYEDGHSA